MIFDKLWEITPEWLKKPTIKKMFAAVGMHWDGVYQKMLFVRRMAIAATSEEKWLEMIGQGKGLRKLAGETWEQYKGRIIHANQFWRDIGQVSGLIFWLGVAGYPATIKENVFERDKVTEDYMLKGQFRLDGSRDLSLPVGVDTDRLNRWAEFEVEVDIGSETFDRETQRYLISLINLARRASKKFAGFYFKETIDFEFIPSMWVSIVIDGTYHIQGSAGLFLDGQTRIGDPPPESYNYDGPVFIEN